MIHLKVLILEDSPDEADYLENFLRKQGCSDIRITTNLKDAVTAYDAELPDICLIDIYLANKPDGILFAETINEHREQRRPFIFLTSAGDSTTFRLAKFTSPYNYLLKPYNPLELEYAIELALSKFKQEAAAPPAQAVAPVSDTLFIKKGTCSKGLPLTISSTLRWTGNTVRWFVLPRNSLSSSLSRTCRRNCLPYSSAGYIAIISSMSKR
ncbi:response regulator [Chitinophaga pinensis]|uniref:Response regulator n=1 Tax=Chitinophaga pinensis TaxID=79329 RepID=A0A5C6LPG5_9BACT|nr:response regulator [Chitinophaga pinensis]